ncbi:hypothetical protein ACN47E_006943 [Coniothyrium glycines]
MVRRTDPKDDNWQHVKDAKKRKQIQDRLAQRARRQRLRATKLHADAPNTQVAGVQQTPLPDKGSTQVTTTNIALDSVLIGRETPDTHLLPSEDPIDPALTAWSPLTSFTAMTSPTTPSLETLDFGLEIQNLYLTSWRNSYLAPPYPVPLTPRIHLFTVYSALYINGLIQSIPCSRNSSRTPLPAASIPLPLRPTELQLMVVHPRWIDRLPFPKMRDSLIRLRGIVDEEEILMDLFTMLSWRIREGGENLGSWGVEDGEAVGGKVGLVDDVKQLLPGHSQGRAFKIVWRCVCSKAAKQGVWKLGKDRQSFFQCQS